MADEQSDSTVQLCTNLSNGGHESSFPRPAPRQKIALFANGLQNSATPSGNLTKELRTEEAELAAVIAKVTGRVNPFVNESNDGERKFTILCGEAACQENDSMNEVSSYLSKSSVIENSFVALGGIEFSKPAVTTLSEVDSQVLITFDGMKDCTGSKSGSTYTETALPKSQDPVERKKDDNANDILDEGNPILCNHKSVMDHALFEKGLNCTKSVTNAKSKSCLEEKEPIIKVAISKDEASEVQTNIKQMSITEAVEVSTSKEISLTSKPASVMVPSKTNKTTEVLNNNMAQLENDIKATRNINNDLDIDQTKTTDSKSPEDVSKHGKTETIKACFPSVKPKVPSKTFVIESPEIQQNIINRRAAARNATSIAEFEPLVTVSPEAEKLAMWKRPDLTEKNTLASPELKEPPWTPPNSYADSPTEGIEGSPGAKDTSFFISEDLRKQALHQKSSEKKNPKEKEAKSEVNKRRDSERGNNDNNNVKKEKGEVPYWPWLVPLLLLVLIPVAVTVIVLLVKFTPWISSDIDSKSNEKVQPSSNALQQILKKLQNIKEQQVDSLDINVTTEVDDIFDSGLSITENGLAQIANATESSIEENDTHNGEDYNVTSSQNKINKHNLIALLTNMDLVTEPPSKVAKGICSSLDDIEAVEICARIKPSVLKLVLKFSHLCQKPEDIMVSDYIKMYRYMNSFLSSFGGFAVIQTKMLEERIKQLEDLTMGEHASEYQNLTQMIHFEISSGTVGNTQPFSGSVIFTCLHRHLQFLKAALEKASLLNAGDTLDLAFEPAYQQILSEHHTWFVKVIYKVGINSLVSVEQAAALLSIRQVESFTLEELQDSLKIVTKELESLNQNTERILMQSKVLVALPKEVIT